MELLDKLKEMLEGVADSDVILAGFAELMQKHDEMVKELGDAILVLTNEKTDLISQLDESKEQLEAVYTQLDIQNSLNALKNYFEMTEFKGAYGEYAELAAKYAQCSYDLEVAKLAATLPTERDKVEMVTITESFKPEYSNEMKITLLESFVKGKKGKEKITKEKDVTVISNKNDSPVAKYIL